MAQQVQPTGGLGGTFIGNPCVTRLFDLSAGIISKLPDRAITSSDSHTNQNGVVYGPENCRIGGAKHPKKAHSWCGQVGGANEITIDLLSSHIVTGVVTQGRGDSAQWVTQYSVQTSENGIDWMDHGRFIGNFDQNTQCKRKLRQAASASFVRFKVLQYHSHPSMRLDVLVATSTM